jgi:hypothetical protein
LSNTPKHKARQRERAKKVKAMKAKGQPTQSQQDQAKQAAVLRGMQSINMAMALDQMIRGGQKCQK